MPEPPSIPPAPDLAAPSPITILPPFSGIHNPAGETVFHLPVKLALQEQELAQVTEEAAWMEEEEKEEEEAIVLLLTRSKQQWRNKGHSAPIERAGLKTGWLISDSTRGP